MKSCGRDVDLWAVIHTSYSGRVTILETGDYESVMATAEERGMRETRKFHAWAVIPARYSDGSWEPEFTGADGLEAD